ncbi:DNA recombination-mediator A family protein [Mycobacterium ulcerans str. Harvey]|uniref:DNA recombination-mediator A family protein n=1 Tax=Mycobacterium ulcerans str. Harvey TaxID=1299332 RepID=A0ABP3AG60_MYCUL|nr:DNA recombination-mediator A family protein [Mycobacterium ulcerans str. Harvey]
MGTRAATAYGEHMAADLAAGLVERDVAVISGGAYGIDGAAHRAVLIAEGTTVAVLAGGVDIPYPTGHSALLHWIGQHGLLVTEYPPGVRPARHRFLTRNRLVAALGGAAVVVEAGCVAVPPTPPRGLGRWADRGRGARAGDIIGFGGLPCAASQRGAADHPRR